MKKFFLVAVFSFTLYASGLDFSGFGNIAKNQKNEINAKNQISTDLTDKEAKNIYDHIKNIEKTGNATPDELLMMAITYEIGHNRIKIKKDVNKSLFYYRKALDAGIVYAGIRGGTFAFEVGKIDTAKKMINDALNKNTVTYEEGLVLNRLGAFFALKTNKNYEADFFIEELAFKFDDSEAALLGFNMNYYGIGVKKNPNMAVKYINAACNSKNVTKKVANFCMTSPLLQKK